MPRSLRQSRSLTASRTALPNLGDNDEVSRLDLDRLCLFWLRLGSSGPKLESTGLRSVHESGIGTVDMSTGLQRGEC